MLLGIFWTVFMSKQRFLFWFSLLCQWQSSQRFVRFGCFILSSMLPNAADALWYCNGGLSDVDRLLLLSWCSKFRCPFLHRRTDGDVFLSLWRISGTYWGRREGTVSTIQRLVEEPRSSRRQCTLPSACLLTCLCACMDVRAMLSDGRLLGLPRVHVLKTPDLRSSVCGKC